MRFVFILGLVSGLGSAGPVGVIQDLGSLGGGNSSAYSINSLGQAAGWSNNSSGVTQAFATGSGGLTNLSTPLNGDESYAFGINDSGVVTGSYYVNGQSHGAIWNGSTVTDLGVNTYGQAINNSGAVAGGNGQAFVYSGGAMHLLGDLAGGNWSAAYAINNLGEAAGYGTIAPGVFRGFYWNGASLVPLGTLGGTTSYAMDLNNNGAIVGGSTTSGGYMNAFAYTGGAMQDLGTLGGTTSYAYGINDSGYIVGYSTTADGASHAFLYMNGSMIDLNAILPPAAGWDLLDAYGINNSGQIVGTALYGGQERAFELSLVPPPDPPATDPPADPSAVPEASTTILTLCGAALLGLIQYLRRRAASAR